jgi:hypothetical protein
MGQVGYDFFTSGANGGEERTCVVCGATCTATRNIYGPTGYVSAMAKQFTYHDEFRCPHSDEDWHKQAVELAVGINGTPSKRVAELMKADLDDLTRENLR